MQSLILSRSRRCCKAALLAFIIASPQLACSQQQVDNDFTPEIAAPLFALGKGPLILVDAGHHNFHTLEDKFAPFGKVAKMDGFTVRSSEGPITGEILKDTRILVIANALNEKNVNSWQLPVYPAFTAEEVKKIRDWISRGGRLLLIADHMPFPGAVADLAQSMGFTFQNGFAFRRPKQNFDVFTLANGMLKRSPLTDMHGSMDSIVSFTGQAFAIPDSATSVITLDSNYKVLLPEVAWKFSADMKMIPAKGLSQLAYAHVGSGKIVVAGEAAMFTAQRVGDMRFGLNAPFARQNVTLLRNILEWLSE